MNRLSGTLADVLNEVIDSLSQVEEDIIDAALHRLADYEDTGLTPEEVEVMRETKADAQLMLTELCRLCDYDRLEELARADHDARLNVLPCKIGDEVWVIRNYKGINVPRCGTVSEMVYLKDMRLGIVVKHVGRGFWGGNIFATKEEAEAALKGGAG